MTAAPGRMNPAAQLDALPPGTIQTGERSGLLAFVRRLPADRRGRFLAALARVRADRRWLPAASCWDLLALLRDSASPAGRVNIRAAAAAAQLDVPLSEVRRYARELARRGLVRLLPSGRLALIPERERAAPAAAVRVPVVAVEA